MIKGKAMAKQKIKVNDLNLLVSSLKSLGKVVESAKISINSEGLTVYGKNAFARGEMTSNSVIAEKDPVEFCIMDLQMFIKVLSTAAEIHKDDISELEMWFDFPFIKIESDKFKTKISTCKEDVIVNSVSQKIKTVLTPVFEFTTSTKQIKNVNSHSFIANDLDSSRIYLQTDSTMENNVVYARIGNDANELNNSITLKFGMVNSGSLGDRKLIINFDRLGVFNIVDSEEILVQLMDKNVLVNTVKLEGTNDDYYTNFKIYTSLLAN